VASFFSDEVDALEVELDDGVVPLREALELWAQDEAADESFFAVPFESVSPAGLRAAAWWYEVVSHLEATGWSRGHLARVLCRAVIGAYPMDQPGSPNLLPVLSELPTEEVLALAYELLGRNEWQVEYQLSELVLLVLAHRGVAIPDALLPLAVYRLGPAHLRELYGALGARALEDVVERAEGGELFALFVCTKLKPVLGELTGRVAACVDRLRGSTERSEQRIPKEWDAGGLPDSLVPDDEGLTPSFRVTLGNCGIGVAPWVDPFAELAEARLDLAVSVDAPELASLDAWCEASGARRTKIAKAIAKAGKKLGLRFVGIEDHAVPVAVFSNDAVGELCLIPGGEYVRGFSAREAKLVRRAKAEEDDPSYEEWGALLDDLKRMRPAKKVTVGPFLLSRSPRDPLKIAAAAENFAALPFRLPTEAEHERALRGVGRSKLTWAGDAIPRRGLDERHRETARAERLRARGVRLAPRGLRGPLRPWIQRRADGRERPHRRGRTRGPRRRADGVTVAGDRRVGPAHERVANGELRVEAPRELPPVPRRHPALSLPIVSRSSARASREPVGPRDTRRQPNARSSSGSCAEKIWRSPLEPWRRSARRS